MKKCIYLIATGILSIAIFSSCATMISGSKAKITVSTSTGEPANANVDGQSFYINGPTEVKVNRGYSPSVINAENEHSKGSVEVKKSFNATTLWNLASWGVLGFVVDGASGSMMKPAQKSYIIPMLEKNKEVLTIKDEPDKKVEGLGTALLESSIIRWDIQSRPQGADIFWRVVSKTPEVKSTNNKYLTTTPYEATKALDIKGLTYQTSGNVRIILRCEKDGYMPQEKEYDVRMLIDQEEISAFFRLVKEE